jgi:hypothetical protein
MAIFQSFGRFSDAQIDDVARELASYIDGECDLRNSSYSGDYCKINSPVGHVIVSGNQDATEDDWLFDSRPDINCVVAVNSVAGKKKDRKTFSERMGSHLESLGFELLRYVEVPG